MLLDQGFDRSTGEGVQVGHEDFGRLPVMLKRRLGFCTLAEVGEEGEEGGQGRHVGASDGG